MKYYIIQTKTEKPLYIGMLEYDNGISMSIFSSSDRNKVEIEIQKRLSE